MDGKSHVFWRCACYSFCSFASADLYAKDFWSAFVGITNFSCALLFLKMAFSYSQACGSIRYGSLCDHRKETHAITVFTTLTIILIAFMPQRKLKKLVWILVFIIISTGIALTRVGVGAHYILDVTIGGIIGYIAAVTGIIFNQKCNLWKLISKKQYAGLLIGLFFVCCVILFQKIIEQQLPVFYLSFVSLCISLYLVICRVIEQQRSAFFCEIERDN